MKNEIVIDGVTYVRKEEVTKEELKLHDLVNYKGYEWYVIGIQNNEVILMMKECLDSIKYSDENSNDWLNSNVLNYLENWAANTEINLNEIIVHVSNYDENKQSYDKVRIPTLREIESLPMEIRECGKPYWTMTASYGVSEDCEYAHVFGVDANGILTYYYVNYANGVRPVITLATDELN